MALDLTGATTNWRQLVEIALDSGTVRYSYSPIALSDGTYYDGRIHSMPALRRSTGAFLDPRIIEPRLTIALNNADNAIRDSFDATTWANRTVTIKVGQGTTAADYTTVYTGTVAFPAGITWDEAEAVINVRSNTAIDTRSLPVNKFNPSTYPSVEEKSQWLPIPLVYGDWSSGASNGEQVPAFCTDTTTPSFKIADHAVKAISTVYKNGVSVAFSNTNLTTATFDLDVSYDELTDTVSANCQGATDDGTSGGTLLQDLSLIYQDILTTHLGVAAGKIDSTAFSSWSSFLSTADYGRRVIANETSSNTILAELLTDGFADIRVVDAKYAPKYRALELSGLTTFRDFDLKDRSPGAKHFSVEVDPQRVYANEFIGDYSLNPISGRHSNAYEKEIAAQITAIGARVRRRIDLNWIYKTAGAESRVEREALLFGQTIEMPTLKLGPRAIQLGPTDQFRLTYNKYGDADEGTPFQVRECITDFQKFSTTVLAWNISSLATYGTWTSDVAPNWTGSSTAQRETQGYWTNASGEAVNGNADSIRSIWF